MRGLTAAARSLLRAPDGLPQLTCSRALSASKVRGRPDAGGDRVIRSRYPDVEISGKSYFDFLWEKSSALGDEVALVDALTDRAVTYSAARSQSANFGAELRRRGARRGDVLALLLPNCVEYPLAFSGAAAAGVTLTTLNPVYTAAEVAKQLRAARVSWAVTTPELLPRLKEAVDKLDPGAKVETFIVGDNKGTNCPSVDELLHSGAAPADFSADPAINPADDICVLPFSSGTTGVPKGVSLTHRNMVGNICQVVDGPPEQNLCKPPAPGYQSSTVCVLPLYHMFAMNVTMGPTLYGGGRLVTVPRFDPQTFVAALEKHRPTFLHLAPPLVSFLANNPAVKVEHLESLEHIVVAAAPSGPALIAAFKAKAPAGVVYREGWGMSETSPIVMMTPMDGEHNGSCGVLVPNAEAKIVDVSTGEALGPMQRGELCCRGPQNMKGYFNNPEATAATVDPDGWLHTGDIGMYDEEERFFIVDRLKELIKVKGFQVAPAELEDLLRGHEEVHDVAVIGVPHERFGEAPRAYLVREAGSSLTEEAVLAFMGENAAPYKQLVGGVVFADAIPKSAAGKILRKDLLASYLEEAEAGKKN